MLDEGRLEGTPLEGRLNGLRFLLEQSAAR